MSASVMHTMAHKQQLLHVRGDEAASSSGWSSCEEERRYSESSRRCVSFSDDHGYPLERYHLIESRSDPAYRNANCAWEAAGDGGLRGMLRNTSEIVTHAGLVVVMLCVVVSSFAM